MKYHNKIKSFSSFEQIMNYDDAEAYNRALSKILKSMKTGKLGTFAHDLDSYTIGTHNCLNIPFDRLIKPKRITGYLTPNWETQIE